MCSLPSVEFTMLLSLCTQIGPEYRRSQKIGDHFNLVNWWFVNKINRRFVLINRQN